MSEYEYILRTENLCKSFGPLEVLKEVSLNVQKGEVICIIGPSGAGKSTYLRSLNQLETITSGKIFIKDELFLHREHNRTIHRVEADKHKALMLEMGMVFQSFNLFPHKTVLENVMIAQVLVRKKSQGSGAEAGRGDYPDGRAIGQAGRLSQQAFRRAAAARGHRPGTGHGTGDHAV